MRKIKFDNGQFYHIFNRGVDKREIFSDQDDWRRFFLSMSEFNTLNPIGSIYEKNYRPKIAFGSEASKSSGKSKKEKKLVNFVCYCLNPNHYHFILEQVADRGIEKFMHRLATGYTKYFNGKYKRSGVLFQGVFKSTHIKTNEYLLHLSAYVNLNFRVHLFGSEASKKVISSWGEYIGENRHGFCNKYKVLGQFRNREDYKEFAENTLVGILERKEILKELEE
jgi:putative transposase